MHFCLFFTFTAQWPATVKRKARREERRGDMDKEDYYSFASGSNPAVPFYIKLAGSSTYASFVHDSLSNKLCYYIL